MDVEPAGGGIAEGAVEPEVDDPPAFMLSVEVPLAVPDLFTPPWWLQAPRPPWVAVVPSLQSTAAAAGLAAVPELDDPEVPVVLEPVVLEPVPVADADRLTPP